MENASLPAILFLAFIVIQRLSELLIAKRNTEKALANGAYEVGASHYPYMVAMHTAWVLALIVFGYSQPVSIAFLSLYGLLQVFRVWILATLGGRWTTRIIIDDKPLVTSGPFRWFRHPNYLLVIVEILVTPMVLGLVWVALVFSILNAAMLYVRITAEEQELGKKR